MQPSYDQPVADYVRFFADATPINAAYAYIDGPDTISYALKGRVTFRCQDPALGRICLGRSHVIGEVPVYAEGQKGFAINMPTQSWATEPTVPFLMSAPFNYQTKENMQ